MQFLRIILVLLLLNGIFAGPAFAHDPAATYFGTEVLPPSLLPPPPQEGDKKWRAQISGVLAAQRHISQADLTALRQEQNLRPDLMITLMGPSFTREDLPKTFMMLDRVFATVSQITESDKQFWHIRRPYLTDRRVKLFVDPIDQSPAYPSGHTSETRVLAEVLGMLKPEKLTELRARAEAIAGHRVEAGVHYPNDLEGGRILAMLVMGALLNDDDFTSDLLIARNEMAGN